MASSHGRSRFSSARLWKPLSFRDVDEAMHISRRKLRGESSGSSSTAPGEDTIFPVAARRRKSLGDIFQKAVKAKWGRDRSDRSSSDEDKPVYTWESQQPRLSSDAASDKPTPAQLCEPPRLNVLSELPLKNNLQRSSTFRAFLEKAATDINNKYGTVQSLPDSRCVGRRPSWRKTLPANSRVVIPIPPRSYFRPREDADPPGTPSLENRDSQKGASGGSRLRHYKTSNRIPAHQVDKILEDSLALRDPPEDGLAVHKVIEAQPSPDGDLLPMLLDLSPNKNKDDQDTDPIARLEKIYTSNLALLHLSSVSDFVPKRTLVEAINDFQNPENMPTAKNPSVCSWTTIGSSHEDTADNTQAQKATDNTVASQEIGLETQSMQTSSSPAACRGSNPETPRVQAMSLESLPNTLLLPPAISSDDSELAEDDPKAEQVSRDAATTSIGSWVNPCASDQRPASSVQGARPSTQRSDTEDTKTSGTNSDCGNKSLESLLRAQNFVASRRRLFESSLDSVSDDNGVSADESGVSVTVAENIRMGNLGARNSQNLCRLNHVDYRVST